MARIIQAFEQELAVAALKRGMPVAMPTETVYGLAADACDDAAVARIFAMKHRPQFNPLIVHIASITQAKQLVVWNSMAERLVKTFWPGALTMVLPRAADCPISLLASAGGDTLAIRMLRHPVAQALLVACGTPLAAPSANRSGRISPTTAQHVVEEFTDHELLVLEGGACEVGLESSVVDLSGEVPCLLRPGSVTPALLEEALGSPVMLGGNHAHSPGMLQSHYAPGKPLRLNAQEVRESEGLLCFGQPAQRQGDETLSVRGELTEAAANLFALLRRMDADPRISSIAVMRVPEEGLGLAINDRLKRAAAPRD